MYEIFEQLLQKFGVTAYKVSKEAGVSQSMLSEWKKGSYTPKQDKLQKIADYFGVTVDYLMNGEAPKQSDKYALTDKDNKDIAKDMESIKTKLINKDDGPASFNGEDIDEAEIELVLDSIEMMLKRLKRINKEKYNPNKNKNKK